MTRIGKHELTEKGTLLLNYWQEDEPLTDEEEAEAEALLFSRDLTPKAILHRSDPKK